MRLWTAAEAATEAARARAQTGVAVLGLIDPVTMPFDDPGEPARKEADELLSRCRERLSAEEADAAAKVRSATESVHFEPLLTQQAKPGQPAPGPASGHGLPHSAVPAQPSPMPSITDQPLPYQRLMAGVVPYVSLDELSHTPFRTSVANWEQWVDEEPGRSTGTLPGQSE
ncbi:MAG TPA: hypothetical protein VLJ59_00200 [Mycobacteriales bacterium]|nr:hypothetical protein [Mycobacteriales bacterium]